MKQLFKKEEMIGKTIAQIIMPQDKHDDMWIKFTDSSFVVFETNDISTGYQFANYVITIDDCHFDKTNEELVELGLISPQEHTNACEEAERKYLEKQRISEEFNKKMVERDEKEYLKILLGKYPDFDKNI